MDCTYLLQLHDGLGCTGGIKGEDIEWCVDVFLLLHILVQANNLCRGILEKLIRYIAPRPHSYESLRHWVCPFIRYIAIELIRIDGKHEPQD